MVQCYWLEATDRAAVYLRRFTWADSTSPPCPASSHGSHDAAVYVGRLPLAGATLTSYPAARADMPPPNDLRWPRQCACGYPFADGDVWQQLQRRLYAPAGRPTDCRPLDEWGPGALYDGHWYPDDWRGPDGIALVARCPNGMDWTVDGPATGGGRWLRTGAPRDPGTLHVQPSIAIGVPGTPGYYHGYLRAGQFTEHIG
jgi:hypothetical protein